MSYAHGSIVGGSLYRQSYASRQDFDVMADLMSNMLKSKSSVLAKLALQ